MNINQRLNALGLELPFILTPKNIDTKWPVIACDQFTQDRSYWNNVKETVGGSPSTLNLIFPEVFLNDGDAAQRIAAIHSNMTNYLQNGIFAPPKQGFVYIERDTPYNKKRRGLAVAVDLEKYEWKPNARPLIRCTEGTVEDRLPPRMDIRRGAPLELPHVLLLIDDETDTLLPALGEMVKKNPPIYDTPLMMESGRAAGWFLDASDNAETIAFVVEKLEELCTRSVNRYGEDSPFLFAVGDGNHSLASAKAIWEEYKDAGTSNFDPDHPCRYALVEIENLYDPAISFEPIHRVVFGLDLEATLRQLSALPGFSSRMIAGREELVRLCSAPVPGNRFGLIGDKRCVLVETSAGGISTASLQPLLDTAAGAPGAEILIDYIHGTDELFRLATAPGRPVCGILLPPVQKSGFFETVAAGGPLPRKSFSMGEAEEKRFYVECRKLFG